MRLKEFAARENITVQRASKLAQEGRIPAKKVGKHWEIDPEATLTRRTRRPLSAQTQQDFITFLNQGTLDHVVGDRRRRLAPRIQEFWASENPTSLLRDWFANNHPEGKGGAALIRAAHRGLTEQVEQAQGMRSAWILEGPDQVKKRVREYMAIKGLNSQEVSNLSRVPETTVQSLMNRGYSPTGNHDGARVINALGIPTVYINTVSRTVKNEHH